MPEWVWLSFTQCHPTAAVCAHVSPFPLFLSGQESRQPALPLSRTSECTTTASLLHPRVIIHSGFKCATTISSLHQKPRISSFLKCQAFPPFDVNDYWTYIKKIPPPILFLACLFQRVTCGSSAWQGRLGSWQ